MSGRRDGTTGRPSVHVEGRKRDRREPLEAGFEDSRKLRERSAPTVGLLMIRNSKRAVFVPKLQPTDSAITPYFADAFQT